MEKKLKLYPEKRCNQAKETLDDGQTDFLCLQLFFEMNFYLIAFQQHLFPFLFSSRTKYFLNEHLSMV